MKTEFSRALANLQFSAGLYGGKELARYFDGLSEGNLSLKGFELCRELIGAAQFRNDVTFDGGDVVLGETFAPGGRGDVPVNSGGQRHVNHGGHFGGSLRDHPGFLFVMRRLVGPYSSEVAA